MSIRAMTAVWDKGPSEPTQRFLLLALADNTNDKTGECFPGLPLLAEKTQIGIRQVQRVLRKLEADGWICVLREGRGRGRCTQFRLNMDKIGLGKGDILTPFAKPEKVTFATVKGDISCNPPAPPIRRTKYNQVQKQIHTAPLQAAVEIQKFEPNNEDASWRAGWNGVLGDLHRALVVNQPKSVQDKLRGDDEWRLYFAGMACEGVDRRGGCVGKLVLRVPNATTAQRGMVKYHKRIHAGMLKYFGKVRAVTLVDSG